MSSNVQTLQIYVDFQQHLLTSGSSHPLPELLCTLGAGNPQYSKLGGCRAHFLFHRSRIIFLLCRTSNFLKVMIVRGNINLFPVIALLEAEVPSFYNHYAVTKCSHLSFHEDFWCVFFKPSFNQIEIFHSGFSNIFSLLF